MQAGQKFGMQTMNQSLMQAVLDKQLTPEDALDRSMDRVELDQMLAKVLRAAA
jgi:Tfp pilus assembly pilus retraction ATPase PilT